MALPQIQKPVPDFSCIGVVDGQFKEINLSDYKGKYLVLFFYPLDFTFVCPTEIIAFSDRAEDFRKIGCELVASSCDSHFSHYAWINMPRANGGLGDINIPILGDKSTKIARDYGIYNEETGAPFRGLFIIDGDQILRQITVNDLPVGRSVDEVFRLVQAFKYTDEYGEVCPVNWTSGRNTIVPNPEESQKFFENEYKE
uniref:thioredoxin-dependent peroxiredoxin n=2 Tax=Timema TaxID=61471 RepID=A0A7R9NZ21_9NEOP|nr:unnamed protein product [Timema bartmani]CAD7461568.1 unnamed protein product [Timema tahoe]